MRIYVFLLLLICIINTSFTQKTPDFATTFYFEDARGNRDSITIGYDSEKVPRMLDTVYGEYPLPPEEVPFDSVFEIRVQDFEFSKVLIKSSPECGKYLVFSDSDLYRNHALFQLYVKIKYPPLKVRWNRNAFEDFCRERSLMQSHLLGPMQGLYDDAVYLVDQDSIVYSEEELLWTVGAPSLGDDNTIRLMNIQFYTGISDVAGLVNESKFNVHPNPFKADFTVTFQKLRPRLLSIYDLNGALIKEAEIPAANEQVEASLQGYPAGTYFCILRDQEGRSRVKKLVKGQ